MLFVRVSFGLSLLFVGLTHYMDMGSFTIMVSDGLGPLGLLGTIWSYIYPALLIVGGVLTAFGKYPFVAIPVVGLALASIPAGMLLKPVLSGVGLDETMPPAINAFIWILVFIHVLRAWKGGADCGCGTAANCACPAPGAVAPAPLKKAASGMKPAPAKKAFVSASKNGKR